MRLCYLLGSDRLVCDPLEGSSQCPREMQPSRLAEYERALTSPEDFWAAKVRMQHGPRMCVQMCSRGRDVSISPYAFNPRLCKRVRMPGA